MSIEVISDGVPHINAPVDVPADTSVAPADAPVAPAEEKKQQDAPVAPVKKDGKSALAEFLERDHRGEGSAQDAPVTPVDGSEYALNKKELAERIFSLCKKAKIKFYLINT